MNREIDLRDYLAGQAIVGLIVTAGNPNASGGLTSGEDATLLDDPRCIGLPAEVLNMTDAKGRKYSFARLLAEEAYKMADAMIEARLQENNNT